MLYSNSPINCLWQLGDSSLLNIEELQTFGLETLQTIYGWATSPQFYAQIGAIIIAVAIAHIVAKQIKSRLSFFDKEPRKGPLLRVRKVLFACQDLLFALLTVFFWP